jgi:hypothetical protein
MMGVFGSAADVSNGMMWFVYKIHAMVIIADRIENLALTE